MPYANTNKKRRTQPRWPMTSGIRKSWSKPKFFLRYSFTCIGSEPGISRKLVLSPICDAKTP